MLGEGWQDKDAEAALGRLQCIVGDASWKGLGGLVRGWSGERSGRSQDLGPVGGVSCRLFAFSQVACDIWADIATALFVFCQMTLACVGTEG